MAKSATTLNATTKKRILLETLADENWTDYDQQCLEPAEPTFLKTATP
jgi:hypothetical protein